MKTLTFALLLIFCARSLGIDDDQVDWTKVPGYVFWQSKVFGLPKIPQKSSIAHRELFKVVSNLCPASEGLEPLEDVQYLRREVIRTNAKLLKGVLNGECSNLQSELENFNLFLITVYNQGVTKAIYVEAIDRIYDFKRTADLAGYLWTIYRKGDPTTFELMTEMQLYLHSKYSERHEMNDPYLLSFGYYLYKIKNSYLFSGLPTDLRFKVERVIKTLPTTVQYLYFEPHLCLYNKGYEEYLYTTDGMYADTERKIRYVFNWIPKSGDMTQGAYNKFFHEQPNPDDERVGKINVEVAFKNVRFKQFLYIEPQFGNHTNMLAGYEAGYEPERARWTFQLKDNALMFQQGNLVLCGSQDLFTYKERRYVKAFNDPLHTPANSICQWTAGSCPTQ